MYGTPWIAEHSEQRGAIARDLSKQRLAQGVSLDVREATTV